MTTPLLRENAPLGTSELEGWIAHYIATILKRNPDELDENATFQEFGLDSVSIVGMTGELSTLLGRDIDPTVVYDHPTIRSLSSHLSTSSATAGAPRR